jgi:glucose-fructose oxidoreductase
MLMPLGLRRSLCILIALFTAATAAPAQTPVRVAIVGLVHDHVSGFLAQLPKHTEVQLVGVSDPDGALRQKFSEKYHLDPKIFFPTEEAMIAATHPHRRCWSTHPLPATARRLK